MKCQTVRTIGLFSLFCTVMIFACGCETVGAVRSGSLKRADIVQMVQLPTPLPRSSRQSQGKIDVKKWVELDFKKTDSWIHSNLW